MTNQEKHLHKHIEDEEAKLAERLYYAQRMSSVGKLAGGVAHNFNNLLMVIMGYACLLQTEMDEDERLREYVGKIINSSRIAANLTQSLLAFSRKGKPTNPQPINVDEVLKESRTILDKLIPENITFKMEIVDNDCIVMADRDEIKYILMHLTTNALDAMPSGGKLTVSTGAIKMDRLFIREQGYGAEGRYALISVTDTGVGMDENTRLKIFEPFFTTKDIGRGTGLGLATVYGIVKECNGYIDVDSAPLKGTTLKIYLPVIASSAGEGLHITAHEVSADTILLAEDDSDVRKLIKTVFEVQGYRVIEAVDGKEAVDKFIKNKDVITTLILDLIMPGKNGKEAYDEIKKMKPDVKVLFMTGSGHGDDLLNNTTIKKEGLGYISKPVSPMKLLERVRKAAGNAL